MTDSFYIVTKSGKSTLSTPSVIALGTFDGVHIAHQRIISETLELAKTFGNCLAGAWCFSSLPALSLGGQSVGCICSLEERIDRMLSLGLDFVAVGDFDALRSCSALDFIDSVLKKELCCVGTVCGFNHRFGKGGSGNAKLLEECFGEGARTVPEIKISDETVSSSAIRDHLQNGDMPSAAKQLGRAYSLTAPVVEGKHLGHTLGFPTANQFFANNCIIPKKGIYATVCTTSDGIRRIGVSNIGTRPSITDGSDSHVTNCETYIHSFGKSIYGESLTVEFCKYLREERKFDSIKALSDQIKRDLGNAIEYFEGEGASLLN